MKKEIETKMLWAALLIISVLMIVELIANIGNTHSIIKIESRLEKLEQATNEPKPRP